MSRDAGGSRVLDLELSGLDLPVVQSDRVAAGPSLFGKCRSFKTARQRGGQ
jgi:hypothetical protein